MNVKIKKNRQNIPKEMDAYFDGRMGQRANLDGARSPHVYSKLKILSPLASAAR